jgi:NAD(P)-dependent dehydrogenase (short-subunit alcohol dehydrogenase family)
MAKVLVTGCNRGIGLQLCAQFHARGDEVIGVCRSASPELTGIGVRVVEGVDVSDANCVAELARTLEGEIIDILINNAGILKQDRLDSIDYDVMLEQYRVNTLGPLRITRALLPNLHEGSKVAIVSSRVGSIEDNSSGNNYGYRVSKVGVNMVGTNLKHDLAPKGIAVGLLHPGLVATDMTGGTGISPAESAKGLIERIDELGLENTGGFWHAEGYSLPW